MSGLAPQALRFALVGLAATATHVAVALALAEGARLGPLAANLAAFVAALLVSYLGNHAWTFAARGRHAHYFPRFAAVALTGLALNQAIVYLAVERLGMSFRAALAVVVLVVPALGLLLARGWAFAAAAPAARAGQPDEGAL